MLLTKKIIYKLETSLSHSQRRCHIYKAYVLEYPYHRKTMFSTIARAVLEPLSTAAWPPGRGFRLT